MDEKKQTIKPITLIREEFVDEMAILINSSPLPFFVIEDILKNFLKEIHIASQHQLEIDKQKYKQELSKLQSQFTENVNSGGDNYGAE